MTVTQVPIIAWEKRYMTPRECAKLQSMEALSFLPSASTAAYKALGNAINVRVMRSIAEALIGHADPAATHRARQPIPDAAPVTTALRGRLASLAMARLNGPATDAASAAASL